MNLRSLESPFRRRGRLLAALSLFCAAGLGAQERGERFDRPFVDADWHLDDSVFECRLVQPMPPFGRALFTRRAGETQRFVLEQDNRYLARGEARVRAEQPEWRDTSQPQPLGSTDVGDGERPVAMAWRESQQLAAALRSGRRLVFTQPAWGQDGEPVELVVEPVGFREGMKAFNDCLADLLPVNFEQVERTALYYPRGHGQLPESEREKLRQIALYAAEDDRIQRFYVDGHTDGVGLREENLELSRERAEMVTEYLVDRGVPEERITTRWHGERYPVGSNRDPEGRADNRRVTVRLEREEEERLSSREP